MGKGGRKIGTRKQFYFLFKLRSFAQLEKLALYFALMEIVLWKSILEKLIHVPMFHCHTENESLMFVVIE